MNNNNVTYDILFQTMDAIVRIPNNTVYWLANDTIYSKRHVHRALRFMLENKLAIKNRSDTSNYQLTKKGLTVYNAMMALTVEKLVIPAVPRGKISKKVTKYFNRS